MTNVLDNISDKKVWLANCRDNQIPVRNYYPNRVDRVVRIIHLDGDYCVAKDWDDGEKEIVSPISEFIPLEDYQIDKLIGEVREKAMPGIVGNGFYLIDRRNRRVWSGAGKGFVSFDKFDKVPGNTTYKVLQNALIRLYNRDYIDSTVGNKFKEPRDKYYLDNQLGIYPAVKAFDIVYKEGKLNWEEPIKTEVLKVPVVEEKKEYSVEKLLVSVDQLIENLIEFKENLKVLFNK